jgi:hypothetical protein
LTPKKAILTAALAAAAIVIGFGAAASLTVIVNAIWPFNYPQDDDTLRERLPVALAYFTWAGTALIVFVLGWRFLSRARK